MPKLPYLVAEVHAAIEMYLLSRTGQQYNRTSFILCDDCCELASKLFLLSDDKKWTDKKPPRPTAACQNVPPPATCPRHPTNIAAPTGDGGYKNFKDVTTDVRNVFTKKRATDLPKVEALLNRIESRRERRNGFFHTTHLLDLTPYSKDCVDALVDLLDYAELLFPTRWRGLVSTEAHMETEEIVLRLDQKSYSDPPVRGKVDQILQNYPRDKFFGPKPKGCEIVWFPEDMHLRLVIRNGGKTLLGQLKPLL